MTKSRRPGLEISIRTVGGVFGDDEVVSIKDQKLTVTNHGRVTAERRLTGDSQEAVASVSDAVADLDFASRPSRPAVDGGSTTIEITSTQERSMIVINAGDDAPQPVWDLLDLVARLKRG